MFCLCFLSVSFVLAPFHYLIHMSVSHYVCFDLKPKKKPVEEKFWKITGLKCQDSVLISINWNCGVLIKKKVDALMIEGWPRTRKKSMRSIHYVFVLLYRLTWLPSGIAGRVVIFPCALFDSHTWSLQILLWLPFNLGLFTHGLNISPLQSGHLHLTTTKKSTSRAVEVIDRGVECIRWYFDRGWACCGV